MISVMAITTRKSSYTYPEDSSSDLRISRSIVDRDYQILRVPIAIATSHWDEFDIGFTMTDYTALESEANLQFPVFQRNLDKLLVFDRFRDQQLNEVAGSFVRSSSGLFSTVETVANQRQHQPQEGTQQYGPGRVWD